MNYVQDFRKNISAEFNQMNTWRNISTQRFTNDIAESYFRHYTGIVHKCAVAPFGRFLTFDFSNFRDFRFFVLVRFFKTFQLQPTPKILHH